MGVEKYVIFDQLAFAEGGRPTFQFSVVGGDKRQICLTNRYGYETKTETVEPTGSKAIWDELLKEKELDMPKICESCLPETQVYLWRTFTDASLKVFRDNHGVGNPLDLDPKHSFLNSRGEIVYKRSAADLDVPGYLWGARRTYFALSVGLSRAILANEPISLLGINCCRCDLSSGFELYTTISDHGDVDVSPINPERLKVFGMSSAGDIVTSIPHHKIADGVAYNVDLSYFDYIKRLTAGIEPSTTNLMHVSDFLSDVLGEIAGQDPAVQNPLAFNILPKTWRPFLVRIPNSTFIASNPGSG